MAAFTAERKKKEIGIRKVLGANVMHIITLLTGEFSRLVIISIGLGLPAAYLMLHNWLDRFEFHIRLNPLVFVGAGLLVLLISWLTVGSQAYRSAVVNPGDCLRDE